ncbi:MAG: ferritin-like domain-containing protein [Myxococcaceae bacterium]
MKNPRAELRDGGAPSHQTLSRTGSACAAATDPAECAARFAALNPPSGFRNLSGELLSRSVHFAVNRGSDVWAVDSEDALKAFLGTIDTSQEATFLVFAKPYGFGLSCTDLERGATRAVGKAGYEVLATTGMGCGAGDDVYQHRFSVTPEGNVSEMEQTLLEHTKPNCAIGRRPDGLCPVSRPAGIALGRHFAEAAHLEAASVTAFSRLARELRAHDAPVVLSKRATQAAREEVRHARMTASLARRFGSEPARPRVTALPVRPLAEIARENAVEGCVRETFGALVALHQAQHAEDPEIRSAMREIAEDEIRHAALAWQIAGWAKTRLDPDERAQWVAEQAKAIALLRAEAATSVDAELTQQAGWPSSATSLRLIDSLTASLWSVLTDPTPGTTVRQARPPRSL